MGGQSGTVKTCVVENRMPAGHVLLAAFPLQLIYKTNENVSFVQK